MNCDQFEDRLHDLLDQRLDPRRDAAIDHHAASCPSCRRDLAWYGQLHQLPATLQQCRAAPAVRNASRVDANVPARAGSSLIGLAAAMLMCIGYAAWRPDAGPVSDPADVASRVEAPSPLIRPTMPTDSHVMLGRIDQLRPGDWIGDSMPVYHSVKRSVSQGVAPLGRSLLRAVTWLTTAAESTEPT